MVSRAFDPRTKRIHRESDTDAPVKSIAEADRCDPCLRTVASARVSDWISRHRLVQSQAGTANGQQHGRRLTAAISLKSAALLAFAGTVWLLVLVVRNLFSATVSIIGGLMAALRLVSELINAFAVPR